MDRKTIGILLIAILATVSTASLSYYIVSKSNQTQNTPSPTPTPTPEPTPSPGEVPNEQASITKPSVPEFTVKIANHSYDVPTTYSIDPYTGETITHHGYHVENKSIEVRIKNQPFNRYSIMDSDGTYRTINLHYNIWVKGHFAENWNQVYSYSDGLPTQAPGEYTVFSLPMTYPSGSQVDFKVEAIAGYVHRPIDPASGWPTWAFTGEESWSNTQTITIP